jgi:hypothetical protein
MASGQAGKVKRRDGGTPSPDGGWTSIQAAISTSKPTRKVTVADDTPRRGRGQASPMADVFAARLAAAQTPEPLFRG